MSAVIHGRVAGSTCGMTPRGQTAATRLLAAPVPLGPTARQMDLLRFVTGYIEANDGVAPTLHEICAALSLRNKSNASALMDRLEARGLIRRIPRRWRAIEIVRNPGVPHAPDGAPLHFIPIATINTRMNRWLEAQSS